jgi:hypothetical protein
MDGRSSGRRQKPDLAGDIFIQLALIGAFRLLLFTVRLVNKESASRSWMQDIRDREVNVLLPIASWLEAGHFSYWGR